MRTVPPFHTVTICVAVHHSNCLIRSIVGKTKSFIQVGQCATKNMIGMSQHAHAQNITKELVGLHFIHLGDKSWDYLTRFILCNLFLCVNKLLNKHTQTQKYKNLQTHKHKLTLEVLKDLNLGPYCSIHYFFNLFVNFYWKHNLKEKFT